MAKRSKGKAEPASSFFQTDLVEAPHADAEMGTKVQKKRRMYYSVITAALIAMPVFAVVSLGNYATVSELSDKEFPAQVVLDTPAKHTAIRAVEDWLSTSPSPLPTGYVLSWDGATVQQPERTWVDDEGKDQYQHGIELHRFTLSTASGAMFTTEVQVAFGEKDGTGILGAPTLIPLAPSDSGAFSSVSGWVGTLPGTNTEPMTDAVKAWVTAFTSGDPAALRITVGDTRDTVSYVPMVGLTMFTSVDVGTTAVFPENASLPVKEWEPDPSVAIAKVSFKIAWPGQPTDAANIDKLGTVTYDVLIEGADTAAPRVVAWGSAGTGTTLKAFKNAVKGAVTKSGILPGKDDGISETSPAPESDAPVSGDDPIDNPERTEGQK
jgi:hypothetical protein